MRAEAEEGDLDKAVEEGPGLAKEVGKKEREGGSMPCGLTHSS